jgi:uncharacterized protein YdaU (DUF1376 family)
MALQVKGRGVFNLGMQLESIMHYYKFNIGDYASHTQHLDEMEDLAYRRMLDYCYLNECGLPESVEKIARVIRMQMHCKCIANVLQEFFFLHCDGTYHSKRADEEIEQMGEKSRKRSEAANKRWKNTDANALQTECKSNATHNTLHITHNTLPIDTVSAVADHKNSKATLLPDDWILPAQWLQWAIDQGHTLDSATTEAAKFADYWHSQPAGKARKRDWEATWRNWIRNARKPSPAQSPTGFAATHTDRSWAVGLAGTPTGNGW